METKLEIFFSTLHKAAKKTGYYPALTGGYLYKKGQRKNVDIVFYQHREGGGRVGNYLALLYDLQWLGFIFDNYNRSFIKKAELKVGETLICFNFIFPDEDEGECYSVNFDNPASPGELENVF